MTTTVSDLMRKNVSQ